MRKNTFLLAVMLIFALTTTKAQTLLGIPFQGDAFAFVNQMKAKGFVYLPENSKKGFYILKGTLLGYECDVYVSGTNKTNQLMKVSAYTRNETTFSSLTATFDNIYALMEAKYGGMEDECLNYFSSPYERHDGYEMTALAVGKYVRMCQFESDSSMTPFMIIDKFPKVRISWEHKENMELNKVEKMEKAKDEL